MSLGFRVSALSIVSLLRVGRLLRGDRHRVALRQAGASAWVGLAWLGRFRCLGVSVVRYRTLAFGFPHPPPATPSSPTRTDLI